MRFLPVFLDLQSGVVVLVGSGEPALSKLRLLDAAGARVRWFAGQGDVQPAGIAGLRDGRVTLGTGDPRCADWSDVVAVVAAAGAPLDADTASCARALRIPVNVVDRPDLSTFIVPAIVDRGDVVVAIGTGGAAPVLARRLRERIEALLPQRIGHLAALMGKYRARLNAALTSLADRRRFWEQVIDGPIGSAVLAGQPHGEALLAGAVDNGAPARCVGTVALVGAGPGDPDLLTLRALHTLQDADTVFYDELVTGGVLDRARRDAERVFVGQRRGEPGRGARVGRQGPGCARDGQGRDHPPPRRRGPRGPGLRRAQGRRPLLVGRRRGGPGPSAGGGGPDRHRPGLHAGPWWGGEAGLPL